MSTLFRGAILSRQPIHLIYRLHGSLPAKMLEEIRKHYQSEMESLMAPLENSRPKSPEDIFSTALRKSKIREKFQAEYDRLLDQISGGPDFLSHSACKKIVIDSWLFLEQTTPIEIDVISVMSNHVHVMLAHREENAWLPLEPLMERHKRFTGTKINALLGRKGERVWARGGFDRDVRKGKEHRVLWYILNNPVKAGMTVDPLNWEGNYLAARLK